MRGDGKNLLLIAYNLYILRKKFKMTPEIQAIVDQIFEGVTEQRLLVHTSKGRTR